jgi:hypothetical protein
VAAAPDALACGVAGAGAWRDVDVCLHQNFLLLCLLAYRLGLPSTVGILAGWGMALVTTPLIWTDQTTLLFPIHALVPHLFELTTFTVLFFVTFIDLGRVGLLRSWFRIGVCVVVSLWMAASSPLTVACLAPFLIVFIPISVFLANGPERLWKLGALSVACATFWLAGAGAYVSGILRAGPVAIFGTEIATYQSGLWWSSIIYQYDRFPAGALLVIVSLTAAVVVAAKTIGSRDRPALLCASITHCVLTCGMIFSWPVLERVPALRDQLRHVRLLLRHARRSGVEEPRRPVAAQIRHQDAVSSFDQRRRHHVPRANVVRKSVKEDDRKPLRVAVGFVRD